VACSCRDADLCDLGGDVSSLNPPRNHFRVHVIINRPQFHSRLTKARTTVTATAESTRSLSVDTALDSPSADGHCGSYSNLERNIPNRTPLALVSRCFGKVRSLHRWTERLGLRCHGHRSHDELPTAHLPCNHHTPFFVPLDLQVPDELAFNQVPEFYIVTCDSREISRTPFPSLSLSLSCTLGPRPRDLLAALSLDPAHDVSPCSNR
jgi:hypothetical protein